MSNVTNLSINITGIGTYGTGIIFQYNEEIGYIITAKHCIYNENKEECYSGVTYTDYEKNELKQIGDPIISEEFDLALIQVKIQKKYSKIHTSDPKNNDEIVFFGYPEYLSESGEGTTIPGKITQIKEKNIVKLSADNTFKSYFGDEHANTRGFSGSGIYVEREGKYYLTGLVTNLEGGGRHSIIVGLHVDLIKKYIFDKTGVELIQYDLLNFNSYLEILLDRLKGIEEGKNKISDLINSYYTEYFEEITPKSVIDALQDNLVCPKQSEFDYSNSTMWLGWLELLLCKCSQSDFDINNFFKLLNQEKERSGIHMFYTNISNLDSFVGALIRSELYDKIYKNDVVFFNNQNKFYGGFLAKKEQLEGMVLRIDDSQVDERFNIHNPNEQKLFPIVHLQHIEEEIFTFITRREYKTQREFVKEFKEKLKELFLEIEK